MPGQKVFIRERSRSPIQLSILIAVLPVKSVFLNEKRRKKVHSIFISHIME